MTRQTVCSVCLVFLLFIMVLFSGLSLCERGLHEVSGMNMAPGAFTLVKSEGAWTLTLTGRPYSLDSSRFFHFLKNMFTDEN